MTPDALLTPTATREGLPCSQVSHIASAYRRYPGETVQFKTRLQLQAHSPHWVLSVFLQKGFELLEYQPMSADFIHSVVVRDLEDGLVVEWQLAGETLPGQKLEFSTLARVLPQEYDLNLASEAILRDDQGTTTDRETVQVFVPTQGEYMKHLPEIYHGNEFLNRLLMLFESFWKPVEQQIAQPDCYYDPNLAPAGFLPWLASWIGVTWDESLPEDRKRRLLGAALGLYQRHGTKQALEDFLKLYTGGEVKISEHRAKNFVLGADARLGPAIALGKNNNPHTFTVTVLVDQEALYQTFGKDQVNIEKYYRQKLEAIIEAQKPAHTAFGLNLQIMTGQKGS